MATRSGRPRHGRRSWLAAAIERLRRAPRSSPAPCGRVFRSPKRCTRRPRTRDGCFAGAPERFGVGLVERGGARLRRDDPPRWTMACRRCRASLTRLRRHVVAGAVRQATAPRSEAFNAFRELGERIGARTDHGPYAWRGGDGVGEANRPPDEWTAGRSRCRTGNSGRRLASRLAPRADAVKRPSLRANSVYRPSAGRERSRIQRHERSMTGERAGAAHAGARRDDGPGRC